MGCTKHVIKSSKPRLQTTCPIPNAQPTLLHCSSPAEILSTLLIGLYFSNCDTEARSTIGGVRRSLRQDCLARPSET
ncbi:hypothetical protein E2C01_031088 [Portunus trituberculatus]|uniref:Uncharacterized protein n=1 Tax=Portunus trituberculatus TaxID=210409 RepID=A0A5B7ESN5_PORTR|nr:hypothetical protein [Portunus trituberculatus]